MRIRSTKGNQSNRVDIPMTPMIDVVFLLLVFFVTTFKIVAPEGDFRVKMPVNAASRQQADTDTDVIRVSLRAGAGGELAGIVYGQANLGRDFAALRQRIIRIVGPTPGPTMRAARAVEIEYDYQLRYEYVIEAVSAVSAYRIDGRLIKLIDKVNFAPPRVPSTG